MTNNKRSKAIRTTKKHRHGIFSLALAFAAITSLAATASVTALSGENSVNTGAGGSASVDGSINTEDRDSSTGADARAESTSENEVSLSNGGDELSNSAETDAGTDVSTSVNQTEDSESEDSGNDAGLEAETEASGEGGAAISNNAATPGNGTGGDVGFGMDLLLRSNILSMMAEPVELDEGDVKAEAASEGEANFESDFTYYKIDHGLEYEKAIYREPARLGGDNVELDGDTSGSFWFGVSAPGEDGTQSQVNHQGKTMIYLKTDEGWKSLEAQFDGEGELQHVNGVEPTPQDETEAEIE